MQQERLDWQKRIEGIREKDADLSVQRLRLGEELSGAFDEIYKNLDALIPQERRFKSAIDAEGRNITIFLPLRAIREFCLTHPELPKPLIKTVEEGYRVFYVQNDRQKKALLGFSFTPQETIESDTFGTYDFKCLSIKTPHETILLSFNSIDPIPNIKIFQKQPRPEELVKGVYERLSQSAAIINLVIFLLKQFHRPAFNQADGFGSKIGYLLP